MANSFGFHGLQHTKPSVLLCPSLSPKVCSDSCPLSQWCHPTSVGPFSSCRQSFPASRSFPMSWFFTSGGQSIRASSFSISPSNEYSRLISFRMGWFDLAVQSENESYSVTSDSLRPMDCRWWNSPGQNTGVGSLFLLQGIFPTQWSKPRSDGLQEPGRLQSIRSQRVAHTWINFAGT